MDSRVARTGNSRISDTVASMACAVPYLRNMAANQPPPPPPPPGTHQHHLSEYVEDTGAVGDGAQVDVEEPAASAPRAPEAARGRQGGIDQPCGVGCV